MMIMRLVYCLLAVAFTLPLLAVSEQDVKRRSEAQDAEVVQSVGGLKGSSARVDTPADEDSSRKLTWAGWSWQTNKKKRRENPNYYHPFPNNIGVAGQDLWKKFDFTAFMGNAIASASSVTEVGGKYVYNSPLSRNAALTEPFEDNASAFLTGDCTRFQNLEILADGNRILGAGLCTFIVSVVTSNVKGSMIVQGELFDVIPSTFSITGGTEDFDGARGTVTFTPFYDNDGTDVFTQASHVELSVDARTLVGVL